MTPRMLLVFAGAALLAAGCADAEPHLPNSGAPPSSPQEQKADRRPVAALRSDGKLTLADVLKLVQERNPALAACAAELRAKDAAAVQAGLAPNPELSLEMENFAGKDALQGIDGAETTVSLSQLIELDGKRDKRQQVAALERQLAGQDCQTSRLDLLAGAAKAFLAVLNAQEQAALNKELAKLAEQAAAAVGERADAGKVAPVAKSRADLELTAVRVEADKAERELETARLRLAAFWDAAQPEFAEAVGDLSDTAPPPAAGDLLQQLSAAPDLARWQSEIKRGEATLALARSQAVPDLTASAGGRFFHESSETALVAGISMPLPFTNSNQGGIAEAQALLDKAKRGQQAAQTALRTELAAAWQNAAAACAEAAALRNELLPGARKAYEATVLGYREGKLDVLQMLDAQRSFFQVRRQQQQALGGCQQSKIDIKRLTGTLSAVQ